MEDPTGANEIVMSHFHLNVYMTYPTIFQIIIVGSGDLMLRFFFQSKSLD